MDKSGSPRRNPSDDLLCLRSPPLPNCPFRSTYTSAVKGPKWTASPRMLVGPGRASPIRVVRHGGPWGEPDLLPRDPAGAGAPRTLILVSAWTTWYSRPHAERPAERP